MPLLERVWEKRNRAPVLLVSGVTILIIALADWWTRPYLALGFLYLFPIMLAAAFLPRTALVAVCVVCTVLTEIFSSLDPAARVIRLMFEMLAFLGCALFVRTLLRNRRFTLETQERLRTLIETNPAAIVTLDQRGFIELANRAALELMAPSEVNLIGQPIVTFLPELQNALPSDRGERFRASMHCLMHRANGEAFVVEVWFSTYKENGVPKLAAIIADVSEQQPDAVSSDGAISNGAEPPSLNPRQVAVLRLVFEGVSNRDIACRLDISPSAVKNTLHQLFSKAGVKNRSQMVRVALERYRDLF